MFLYNFQGPFLVWGISILSSQHFHHSSWHIWLVNRGLHTCSILFIFWGILVHSKVTVWISQSFLHFKLWFCFHYYLTCSLFLWYCQICLVLERFVFFAGPFMQGLSLWISSSSRFCSKDSLWHFLRVWSFALIFLFSLMQACYLVTKNSRLRRA